MAQSPKQLIHLYQEALETVTATPENWLAFLQSAGRNFRYPFQDQLLIHHQRPDTVAVLTYDQWDRQFGRRARRGSTGIAVFGRSQGRTQVKYYFDVQDTYPTRAARPVPLWTVTAEDHGPLLELLTEKFSATAPVLPMAVFETTRSYTSAMVSGNWTLLQESGLPVDQDQFQRLVENSVSFLLLHRMGLEQYARFYPKDFDALEQFQTPEAINLLGDMVSTISETFLVEIAATVRAVHRNGPELFAESQRTVYDEAANEEKEQAQGGQTHGDAVQNDDRHEPAGPDAPGGADGDGQVRDATGELSPGTPAQPVPEPADQRTSEPAPDGSPEPGVTDAGGPDAPAPEGGGRDRDAKGQRPDDLGGPDEQSQAQRRGDDPDGAGVQLSIDEPEPSVKAPGSFSVPVQEDWQLSVFDAADVAVMEGKEGQISFMPSPQYSQEVLDEALRIGANDQNSRLVICAYFMKDKSTGENARFLQEHYGTNGAGFYYAGQKYAIWYDQEGIRVAVGESAQARIARRIPWEEAAGRIRELLDEGRYMPQRELDRVVEYERDRLADRLALTARDMSEKAREAGYAPTIREAVKPGVFPACKDNIYTLLSEPDTLQTVVDEWTGFVHAYEQDHELMLMPFYRPQPLLEPLRDLQIEPLTFSAAGDFDPQRQFFISNDEIDQVLRRDGTDYRLSVYQFFQSHSDRKERVEYLKKYHGEYSGSYGGNDNLTFTAKSLTFSHGSVSAPYALVELTWSKAERRIAELIRSDRFLTVDDRASLLVEETQSDRVDEMLRQAELAAKLSEETGQNVFAFEEGNPQPVAFSPETVAVYPGQENQMPYDIVVERLHVDEPEQTLEPAPVPAVNFHITDDTLGCGSVRQKFQANLAAIRLLKELEAEKRDVTAEEQETLSRYVGWGGMPQVFDPENHAWATEYAQLKEALEDFEYTDARSSVLNAHYTSPTVIKAIYEAVGNLGFTSGNILEPACGVGNFFGLLPEEMSASRLYGVELDSISGRIAQKLYPEADITVAGFETTDRRNFYDLAIGNVPFGQYRVNDKAYNSLGFNIHNYFLAKAIDQVRPGGIVAFVTSRYTMDAQGQEVRKYIAERAELLGAIRLPNNAFLANAGTQVVSDILFLQKRERAIVSEPDWLHLGKTVDGLTINSYFLDHPEMVLGELSAGSSQYGREECTVRPIPGADLGQQLHAAVQHIQGQYMAAELDADVEVDDSIPADPEVKNFSFTLYNNTVYYRENSRMNPVSVSETAGQRIHRLMELRDCVRQLIAYETEDFPETDIQRQQAELNRRYDAFRAEYGIINSKANRQAFSEDDSYYLLCSLEILDDEQNFQRKADIFTKRTIRPRATASKVETAQEALVYCLNDRARVDMPFMAALTGKPQEVLEQELSGQTFRLPSSAVDNPVFVLAEARTAAAENPIYVANVAALEQVQPQKLSAAEISVRLGSTWVPEADVEQFIYDLLKPTWYLRGKIRVHYSAYTGAWQVEGKSVDRGSIYASSTYGTDRASAYHIIEDSLNLREVRVLDYVEVDGKRKPVLNKRETAVAQGKQAEIKQAFQDWIWKDPDRRQRLTTLYNEKFNNIRPREYDGSHLIFPGMNPEINLRPHRKNAIARALYGGNTLLAHCVGAGKTFEMVAIAQESKRLGLCQKSMVVVPNHLIGQWASEYLQLYPAANILVATEKDFTPARRKTFCSRISTGDYDTVIIGHSQFEKIPLSRERQTIMLEHQIEDIVAGIAEEKQRNGNSFTVKQLERSRKSVQVKLQKLNDQSRKDNVVTFEELGIDRLFVDEAHEFKNLAVVTKMQNVAGISQTESQKASDMFLKCRYLDELTDSRGIIFGTGTPISNTMVELYTMQRYLQYRTLEYYGLTHFDAWAANFGETVTAIELSPEGTGYRTKTRFARFYNLPELIYMFRMVADIQTANMLNLPVPKANYHVEQLEPSELQREMVKELSDRADKVRNKMVDPKEDNMLRITGDGRKLALDQRLMNPMLPDDENSKTAVCARNVYDIWLKTADNKGAQIIFCDLSTPHFDGSFNLYDDLREKLTSLGIPREEIVFIHEAPTEAKKKELFAKVRSGQVRVIMGSTAKMGTGTNVQTRLAALHDADCPWRPSDLEQRSGRIIRQGNTYEEVDIYRYVTKDTFDAFLWQIVETKQRFISQIMTEKSPARTMEDTDESTLSYAEIKALATGNPLIKEKMDLDVTVSRLTLLKSSFMSQKYSLEDQIYRHFPQKIQELEQRIRGFTSDMEQVKSTVMSEPGKLSPMEIEGTVYTEKKDAGAAILAACKAKTSPENVLLGSYRGFEMDLSFETFYKEFQITFRREHIYVVSLGSDSLGNLQRIDNALDGIENRLNTARLQLETTRQELETAKEEVQKPFPQEQELQEKSARLQELNSLLNMDQRDDTILDEETEEETVEKEMCLAR